MRSFALALLLAGSLSAAGAASAQEQYGSEGKAHLVSAFTTVCLNHLGDPVAQIVAARAGSLNFAIDNTVADDMARFTAPGLTLGVSQPLSACTMTIRMSGEVSLASMQATMTAMIGTGEGEPLAQGDSLYWLIADSRDEEHVLSLRVSTLDDSRTATLWVQRRATLSN